MYLNIDRTWFEKNRDKLLKEGKDMTGEEDTYLISFDGNMESDEYQDGRTISLKEEHDGIYLSTDYTPDDEDIARMIEVGIDSLSGESLVKVVQSLVTRLNKFKSALESLKGL